MTPRPLHPDFLHYLDFHDQKVIALFKDLRNLLLEAYPDSNEILYHTHVLSAVFSLSEKLSDAFCHLPVYTNHINLGFNKGALLKDPHDLLQGSGKLIRHIPIHAREDFDNEPVKALLKTAFDLAVEDMDKPSKSKGIIISKIKP
jgi:hypothetical protein